MFNILRKYQVKVKVAQSCPALCNPWIVHGIPQARLLEWVAVPFSRGSSQPRDGTQVSCIAGRFFTSWVTLEILNWFPNSHTTAHSHQKCMWVSSSLHACLRFNKLAYAYCLGLDLPLLWNPSHFWPCWLQKRLRGIMVNSSKGKTRSHMAVSVLENRNNSAPVGK